MSELRSAVEGLRGDHLGALPDDVLADRLDEIERASRILDGERGRTLVEIDRRKTYAGGGQLSTAAWLAHRYAISRRSAEGAVRRALALEQMPEVWAAFSEGELSTSAVNELARARDFAPEAFPDWEEALVEAARAKSFGELHRVVESWRAAAEPARAIEEEDGRYARRRLDVIPSMDGLVRVDGELDPETGQSLITAIRAVTDVEARSGDRSDVRTPTQRRVDALGEVCRGWLASFDRPSTGGEVPHVIVTMDVAALERRAGRSELQDAGRITPETARRLACDANVTRVVTDARSEPLDLGRRTKVVPAGLRRAVTVRDGGCRFPGCERPPGWCDAHHVRHWADGGETSIHNLLLLCRPHHRAIHRGFNVSMVDGRPVFTRPDGTTLVDRAPP